MFRILEISEELGQATASMPSSRKVSSSMVPEVVNDSGEFGNDRVGFKVHFDGRKARKSFAADFRMVSFINEDANKGRWG
jgi:hypothetical protein